MTVLEAIKLGTDQLASREVDSPRLQAELLLAHVLSVPRLNLYLDFERTLAESEASALRGMINRRGQREPLQHIIGSTSFCGLELAVNRQALVPRPETELLAELAWQHLNLIATPGNPSPTAIDFGTGTGCLAIAMAVKCPTAKIVALDISEPALNLARENASRHGVLNRIEFAHGDGFAALPDETLVDLIVSNPPYIASGELEKLEPEVRRFDPREALDGGPDGLDFYRLLARDAAGRLNPGGHLLLEFGDHQTGQVSELLARENWIVHEVKEDYSGRQRILVASRMD